MRNDITQMYLVSTGELRKRTREYTFNLPEIMYVLDAPIQAIQISMTGYDDWLIVLLDQHGRRRSSPVVRGRYYEAIAYAQGVLDTMTPTPLTNH